jgi:DNA-binding CsgD family transcriptional regulator
MGELDAALAACDEAAVISARLPRTYLATSNNWAKASVHLEQGDPQRAVDVLLHPTDGSRIEDAPMPGPLLPWHLLAQAEAQCGRVDDARVWLKKLDDALPLVAGLTMPSVWHKRAMAAILVAEGEPLEGAQLLVDAAVVADRGALVYEGTVSRHAAGLAFAAAGERKRAIAELDRARREFERYGVARKQDAITRELRRLGVRIGRGGRRSSGDDARDGIASLSDREREIAALVAEGRTNKEIGDVLFISTRTVERHLSHVFDKLGVDSRSQLGALVERSRR